MSVYDHVDYKKIIKNEIKSPGAKRKFFTLKKLSHFIGIQYTFLSKCLNSDTTHLNEDHLYRTCEYFNFTEDEKDYLLLLRQRDVSQNSQRKEYLTKKIGKTRTSKNLQGDTTEINTLAFNEEVEMLLEPMADLVYLGLQIPFFKKDPIKFAGRVGITIDRLRVILDILEKNSLITRDSEFEIKKTILPIVHRSRTHPLVRSHQQLMKSQLQQKLFMSPENTKESYVFSFNGNARTFELIKKDFQQFIKKVQNDTTDERPSEVFQISFDLLKWT